MDRSFSYGDVVIIFIERGLWNERDNVILAVKIIKRLRCGCYPKAFIVGKKKACPPETALEKDK